MSFLVALKRVSRETFINKTNSWDKSLGFEEEEEEFIQLNMIQLRKYNVICKSELIKILKMNNELVLAWCGWASRGRMDKVVTLSTSSFRILGSDI